MNTFHSFIRFYMIQKCQNRPKSKARMTRLSFTMRKLLFEYCFITQVLGDSLYYFLTMCVLEVRYKVRSVQLESACFNLTSNFSKFKLETNFTCHFLATTLPFTNSLIILLKFFKRVTQGDMQIRNAF